MTIKERVVKLQQDNKELPTLPLASSTPPTPLAIGTSNLNGQFTKVVRKKRKIA